MLKDLFAHMTVFSPLVKDFFLFFILEVLWGEDGGRECEEGRILVVT